MRMYKFFNKSFSDEEIRLIKIELILIFIFLVVSSYYFKEINLLHNTIGGYKFASFFMLTGGIVSFFLMLLILKKNPNCLKFKHFEIIMTLCLLLTPLMIFTRIGFEINSQFRNTEKSTILSTIENKYSTIAIPKRNYVEVRIEKNLESLVLDKTLWNKSKIGSQLEIKIQEGYLGGRILSDFRIISPETGK